MLMTAIPHLVTTKCALFLLHTTDSCPALLPPEDETQLLTVFDIILLSLLLLLPLLHPQLLGMQDELPACIKNAGGHKGVHSQSTHLILVSYQAVLPAGVEPAIYQQKYSRTMQPSKS